MKKTIINIILLTLSILSQAQPANSQRILFATTEKEMFNIYEQILDSAITLKTSLIGSYFRPIENKDTLMKFEQYCFRHIDGDYICERDHYRAYLSTKMSIAFYEQLLDYLKKLWKNENAFYKRYSIYPLFDIKNTLITKLESGELTKGDSLKALELIEQTTLRIVNDAHSYNFLYGENKYMTKGIQQALVKEINDPIYPDSYLNYYLSEVVDTSILDTTGIPHEIRQKYEKWKGLYTSGNLEYDLCLGRFYNYKKLGDKLGISPGQAYLKEKENEFQEKGYYNINTIVDYATANKDTLLLRCLKEFKKKYPDYPLKDF